LLTLKSTPSKNLYSPWNNFNPPFWGINSHKRRIITSNR
jgi:hypothetical protein